MYALPITVLGTNFFAKLNIPRIEDGNNFGVSVQEDAIKEVGHCEDFAFEFLGGITKYYISRAKLITKVFFRPAFRIFQIHTVKSPAELACALVGAHVDQRLLRSFYRLDHHGVILIVPIRA
jgi:hypothetical protein